MHVSHFIAASCCIRDTMYLKKMRPLLSSNDDKNKKKWDKPVKALEVLLILFLPADLYIFPSSSCLLFHQHRKSLVERSYSSQRNEGDCFLFNFFPLSFPLVTSCSYKTWVSFYCISHRFFSLIFFFSLLCSVLRTL